MIRNAIGCLLCGDVIEAEHEHDWKSCKCGSVRIDDGKHFIYFNNSMVPHHIDLSQYE